VPYDTFKKVHAKPNETLHILCPWPTNLDCNDWHGYSKKKSSDDWDSNGQGTSAPFWPFIGNPVEFTPTMPLDPGERDWKLVLTKNGNPVRTIFFDITVTRK